jgi:hypothetical protein
MAQDSTTYSTLSLKDLLDAREAYHWHLMNRENVIGTAVGKYLIRKADSWPGAAKSVHGAYARTFANSEVRAYSWPCIMVLVSNWVDAKGFGQNGVSPSDFVPPTLYLPDGRCVPVCVVQVQQGIPQSGAPTFSKWPQYDIGAGCPVYAMVQGREHMASVGCLVTDGHRTYALTNRHVVGEPGTQLFANLRGNLVPIGVSAGRQLTRERFSKVLPAFAGDRSFLTLDIGLIDVNEVDDWTSAQFGLAGTIGPVVDVNELSGPLNLIDQPVIAFGAASGLLKGSVKALFYRYKAQAGFDFISEFLIAPDDGATETRHGDSGTAWYLYDRKAPEDDKRLLRPLAIEWGGQDLGSADGATNFTLATSLATACELLDVDFVRVGDTGASPFWGQVGHYSIATAAIDQVQNTKLKAFLSANLGNISFEPGQLSPDQIRTALASGDFVELADVPDLVWKKVAKDVPGGRDYARNAGPEHPNHYADIDAPGADGQNLRDLTLGGGIDKMDVAAWSQWYQANGQTDTRHQGLLPFRVWQLYDVMVSALQQNDAATFLCAAGVISHYIGDACQPLHGSYHADGYSDQQEQGAKSWPGKGVHSAYEDNMVDKFADQLQEMIGPEAEAFDTPIHAVQDGRDAGFATVELMAYSAGVLAPSELIDKYISLGGGKSQPVLQGLWDAFGTQTGKVMGAGARYLAAIWDAAYAKGGKPALGASAIDQTKLAKIYQDDSFAPSLTLDKIGTVLSAGASTTHSVARVVKQQRTSRPSVKSGRTRRTSSSTRKRARG